MNIEHPIENPIEQMLNSNSQPTKMNREQRRAARKAAKKEVSKGGLSYDELEVCYNDCRYGLSLALQLKQPVMEVYEEVENKEYLLSILDTLSKDTEQLAKELEDIRSTHAGKSGKADVDNVMDILATSSAYQTWLDRYNGTVTNSHDAIADVVYQVELKRAVANGNNPEEVKRIQPLNLGE